jgi:hypothetical protein
MADQPCFKPKVPYSHADFRRDRLVNALRLQIQDACGDHPEFLHDMEHQYQDSNQCSPRNGRTENSSPVLRTSMLQTYGSSSYRVTILVDKVTTQGTDENLHEITTQFTNDGRCEGTAQAVAHTRELIPQDVASSRSDSTRKSQRMTRRSAPYRKTKGGLQILQT